LFLDCLNHLSLCWNITLKIGYYSCILILWNFHLINYSLKNDQKYSFVNMKNSLSIILPSFCKHKSSFLLTPKFNSHCVYLICTFVNLHFVLFKLMLNDWFNLSTNLSVLIFYPICSINIIHLFHHFSFLWKVIWRYFIFFYLIGMSWILSFFFFNFFFKINFFKLLNSFWGVFNINLANFMVILFW